MTQFLDIDECRVELHPGSPELWNLHGKAILYLEELVWPSPEEGRLPSDILQRDLSDPSTIVGLLWNRDDLLGFTYLELPSRLSPERLHDDPDVRHVSDTAIRREHQCKGLVKYLMLEVDAYLVASGISFVTRNASIANGYADKLERAYKGRVVERRDHQSRWGAQRWMKILL